jgi:hypothetical protein
MSKTRLYVECPNCSMQYMVKDFSLTYSNGARIEDAVETPEWQVLICPCRPGERHKFKLKEKARIHVFSESESERTHYSLTPRKSGPTAELV